MNSLAEDSDIQNGGGNDAFQFSDFDGINDEDFNHNFYGFSGGSQNLSPKKGLQPITTGLGSFDPIPMQNKSSVVPGPRKFGLGNSNFDAIPMNSNDDVFGNNPIQQNAGFNSFNMDNNLNNNNNNNFNANSLNNNNNNLNGFDAIPMGDNSSKNSRVFGDLPQQNSGKKGLFDGIPFGGSQQSNFDSVPFGDNKNQKLEKRLPLSQSNASIQSNASGSKRLLGGSLLKGLTQSSNAFQSVPMSKVAESNPNIQTINEEDDIFADAAPIGLKDSPNVPRASSNAFDFKQVSSNGIPFSSSIDSFRPQNQGIITNTDDATQQNIGRPAIDRSQAPQIQLQIPGGSPSTNARAPPKSMSVPFRLQQNDKQQQQSDIKNPHFLSEDENMIPQHFNSMQEPQGLDFPSPTQFKHQNNSEIVKDNNNLNTSPFQQATNQQQPQQTIQNRSSSVLSNNQNNFMQPQQTPQFPQQTIQESPQQAFQTPQPQIQKNQQYPIEIGFSASLDRSLANFKRSFTNDFSSLIRQNQKQNTTLFEVDDFMDQLNSDVISLIETPVNPIDLNTQSISRKISLAIDEHTKPVSAALAEADARNSVASEHHISELKQLQEEIDSLRSLFKSCSDNLLRELDRERQNSSQERDVELNKKMEVDQRMRTLRLKKIELDTKIKNQQIEKDSIERSVKSFEQKRKDWEENILPKMLDETGAIKSRILQELNSLRSEITQESFDDLNNTINEGINMIREEGDNLRNELIDLEMVSRWLSSKPKTQVVHSRSPKRLKKSSVLDQTQEKLNRIRKQRAETIKSLTDQL